MRDATPDARQDPCFTLVSPLPGIQVNADHFGLLIVSESGHFEDPDSFARAASNAPNSLGRAFPAILSQALELGRATEEAPGQVRIVYEDLQALEAEGIRVFEEIVPWAPFVIELHSDGSLGTPSFRYRYRFYLGTQQVHPTRCGAFARYLDRTYRFDNSTYNLLTTIDQANEAAETQQSGSGAWVAFSTIKGLAEDVGAQLDNYIHKERIIIPSELGVDIDLDAKGRVSLVPRVDATGVDPAAFKKSFLRFEEVQDVYSLDHPDGGRIRVALGDLQKEALRRMQRVRHVFGSEKARVLSNPASVFDGVTEVVKLDDFGPRVEGIGKFPFVSRPFIGSTGVFDEEGGEAGPREKPPTIGIESTYPDGTKERIEFRSVAEFKKFLHEVRLNKQEGKEVIDFKGRTITLDDGFSKGMEDLAKRILGGKGGQKKLEGDQDGRYLLIYRNEDEVDYVEEERAEDGVSPFKWSLPTAFETGKQLKEHQKEGVEWLELNYSLSSRGRRGCLLADDMGLGKTLQILTFLAWVIERGDLGEHRTESGSVAWNPILVVTPVILLEAGTWVSDIETFFAFKGNVFSPYLVLHGKNLKALKKPAHGRETTIGEPVLDLDKIRQHRIVFTNYETVVNYQHSLARIKWTTVITDEAQEYKTPSSKISHALKSLDPAYRIACTGTPVETRLLDLWNIFDFLQPGPLLGSKKEFSDSYEKPLEETHENRSEVLGTLKRRLRMAHKDSYVKRREKTLLADLPTKHEHVIDCVLSEEQRSMHEDFIGNLRTAGPELRLSVIHNLMFLYQHPELVRSRDGIHRLSTEEIIELCPKLKAVLQTISSIRKQHEKVLIFTRSLVMQQVLARTIGETAKTLVDIVNGATKRSADTKAGAETRRGILQRFQAQPGFGAIVLSPDVAGCGLTLTEANHVIHYGRWWNPAKEAQATDRAYRIGQEKDVHVYVPIAKDPRGEFKTFDEKLNTLLMRRRDLARDFLMPMPAEDDLGRELADDMLDGERASSKPPPLTMNDLCSMTWDRFEALAALLEQKEGRDVILTPGSGDQGMDVLSLKDRGVRVIQCKHSSFSAELEEDVLEEMVSAFDGYRARYFAGSMLALNTVLFTNGVFSRKAKEVARRKSMKLVGGVELKSLLERYPVTLAQVEAAEGCRCSSMRDVARKIEHWKQ
ncbi:MAG: restriction endonuclease [Deltaproteobacteria bacterium]|nr:restriction endonuclease [Deltaproteobacteria bacterium]